MRWPWSLRGIVHVVTVKVFKPGDRVNGRPIGSDQVAVTFEDERGLVIVYAAPESMQRLLAAALDEVDKLVTVRARADRMRDELRLGVVQRPLEIEGDRRG